MKERLVWTAALAGFFAMNVYAFWAGDLAGLARYLTDLGPWGQLATVDLLAALFIAVAWTWRDARALGRSPWPWVFLTLGTGSLGLLAYLAAFGTKPSARVERGPDGRLILRMTRELAAPVEQVWPAIAAYERVDLFHPYVDRTEQLSATAAIDTLSGASHRV